MHPERLTNESRYAARGGAHMDGIETSAHKPRGSVSACLHAQRADSQASLRVQHAHLCVCAAAARVRRAANRGERAAHRQPAARPPFA
eukprot:759164-Pleurochrysis_carterae.AAC.2